MMMRSVVCAGPQRQLSLLARSQLSMLGPNLQTHVLNMFNGIQASWDGPRHVRYLWCRREFVKFLGGEVQESAHLALFNVSLYLIANTVSYKYVHIYKQNKYKYQSCNVRHSHGLLTVFLRNIVVPASPCEDIKLICHND